MRAEPDRDGEYGLASLSERAAPFVRKAVVITTLLVIAVLAWEYLSPGFSRRGDGSADGGASSDESVVQAAPPPVSPLDAIPEEIDGFRFSSRQLVPGSGDAEAEAFLSPTGEFFTDSVPFQVYVRVRYHPDEGAAIRHVVQLTSDVYTEQPGALPLGAVSALSGRTRAGAQFIGWAQDRYSLEVDARFIRIRRTDAAPEMVFEQGQLVARAVEALARQRLPRGVSDE